MGTSGLGALLVDEGLLTEADRRTIKRTCGSHGPAFARSIVALGLLDEDELAAFLAEKTPWHVASKEPFKESRQDVWGVVDRPLVERLEVLPLKIVGETLHVAMVDPLDHDTLKQLAFFTGYKIHPVISTLTHIRQGLSKLLKNYQPATSQLESFLTNHASTAGRRVRQLEGGLPSPAPKKPASRQPATAAPAAKSRKAPQPDASFAMSDGDDFTIDQVSVPDLQYPDSVTAAEVPRKKAAVASVAAKAPGRAAPAASSPMEELDDFGDIETGLDAFGEDDSAPGPTQADAALPAKGAATGGVAVPAGSDSDIGGDLSEFDPDEAGGGLEDLDALAGDLNLGTKVPPKAAKAAAPAKAANDLFGDDIDADLGADLEGDLDGDLSGDLAELSSSAPAPAAAAPLADGDQDSSEFLSDDMLAGALAATPGPQAADDLLGDLTDDTLLPTSALPAPGEDLLGDPLAGILTGDAGADGEFPALDDALSGSPSEDTLFGGGADLEELDEGLEVSGGLDATELMPAGDLPTLPQQARGSDQADADFLASLTTEGALGDELGTEGGALGIELGIEGDALGDELGIEGDALGNELGTNERGLGDSEAFDEGLLGDGLTTDDGLATSERELGGGPPASESLLAGDLAFDDSLIDDGLAAGDSALGGDLAFDEGLLGDDVAAGASALDGDLAAGDSRLDDGLAAGDGALGSDLAAGDSLLDNGLATHDSAFGSDLAAGDSLLDDELAAGDSALGGDLAADDSLLDDELATDFTGLGEELATEDLALNNARSVDELLDEPLAEVAAALKPKPHVAKKSTGTSARSDVGVANERGGDDADLSLADDPFAVGLLSDGGAAEAPLFDERDIEGMPADDLLDPALFGEGGQKPASAGDLGATAGALDDAFGETLAAADAGSAADPATFEDDFGEVPGALESDLAVLTAASSKAAGDAPSDDDFSTLERFEAPPEPTVLSRLGARDVASSPDPGDDDLSFLDPALLTFAATPAVEFDDALRAPGDLSPSENDSFGVGMGLPEDLSAAAGPAVEVPPLALAARDAADAPQTAPVKAAPRARPQLVPTAEPRRAVAAAARPTSASPGGRKADQRPAMDGAAAPRLREEDLFADLGADDVLTSEPFVGLPEPEPEVDPDFGPLDAGLAADPLPAAGDLDTFDELGRSSGPAEAAPARLTRTPEAQDQALPDAGDLPPTDDFDCTATAASALGMRRAACLNRALLAVSMAVDAHEGIRKAAASLAEAGLSRGLLVTLTNGLPRAVTAWEDTPSGAQVRKDNLGGFVTPGMNIALSRLYAGWAPFGEGVRADTLKPFHRWLDREHQMMAAAVPIASGHQMIVICAWQAAAYADPMLRTLALEFFRRLARQRLAT